MIRPGLCSVTFRDLDVPALIDLAAETGVQVIEWGGDTHVPPGDLDLAAQVRALCAAKGILPASYGSYVRTGTPDARAAFADVLATARVLGAGNIRVWAGEAKRAEAGAQVFDTAAADLAHFARSAAQDNITVSVEYHRRTLTEEAEDALALLDAAAEDNLYSYWQPVPGRGLARWLEELEMLAPHLGDLHVFHWIMTDDGQRRRPLAEGLADWRVLFDAWSPAPRWPHPRTAFLEFVRDNEIGQYHHDMHDLRTLCGPSTD
ncbi:TIM barrel protein [Fluviibacterium sp. DFM31]|uniref:TIM barrel protein n=1 Tax=Meridianimarinicoccus marinus TaxID=3231483 RepID=A0ABV3L7K6_9RHOB